MTQARHILVVTALLSASAGRAFADDWTMGGFDPSLAHRTAERSNGTWASQPWTWTAPHGAQLVASPVVADGVAVVAAMDGNVYGLAATSGRLLWQFSAADGVQGTPAVLNGKVFVASLDGKLYALHLANGKVAWQKPLGGLGRSSPVIAGASLIVARGFPGDTLLRLDPGTGNTVWETAAGTLAPFSNSAAASDGTRLIIGANEGHYLAFDLASGKQLWKYEAGGIVNLSAPLLAGGRAYFLPGGSSGRLHAVDVATGAAIAGWPIELPAPAPDIAGTSLGREFSVSSVAASSSNLIVDYRSDDFLDTDKDGTADQFLLRETVAAFDLTSGALVWQQANGRQLASSFNDIPKNWLCPTPAVYGRMGGAASAAPYLLAASTLTTAVRSLDAGSGAVLGTSTAAGPAGPSPILANGRSFVATTAGTLQSWASRGNLPPGAPAMTEGATRAVNNVAPVVHWAAAMDPEGQTITYQARLDGDGELLESWAYTITTSDTTWRVAGNLDVGKTYVVAVRARDSQGAWSDWSAPQTLTVEETPPVSVGGTPQPSLAAALMAAQPGDVVRLGAGRMRLGETLRVPAGVTMEGAGPQRTIIDATGRDTGIALDGSAAGQATQVRGLTVTGARTGISVGAVHDARLTNIIVRDSSDAGVNVGAAGVAILRNGTLVANGRAAVSFGSLLVKNSLVTANYTGLVADHADALVSQFNDVSGNAVADYQGLVAAPSDLSAAVSFVDFAGRDLHLPAQQPSTDRGDPADDFSAEPAPNGGRINLGAFGGTSEAELSAEASEPTMPPDGSADGGVPPGGTQPGGGGAGGATSDGGAPNGPDAGAPNGGTPVPSSPSRPSPTQSPAPPAGPGASGSSGGGCDVAGTSGTASLAGILSLLAFFLLAVRRGRPRASGQPRASGVTSGSTRRQRHRRAGWVIAATLVVGGLWAAPAHAIVRVQYCTGANNSAASTSVTCTWPSPTTAGNGLLAVLVESSNNGFVSPTTEGTGWTMGNAQKDAGNLHIRNFINLNASSRSGTVTWTFSPATNAAVYMVEYSNLLTSNAQDMNAANTGTSSTANTGTTSTLGQAIEVGIGVVAVPNSSLTFSGESITEVAEKASTDATYGFNAAFLETITNSTTGVGTNATISGSATWVGFMNTFKGTAGGTGGGTAGLWVGSQTGHLWSNTANWSNGALPASTDTVVLNSTGNNAMVIDQDVTVAGFSVNSGYTNSITTSGTHNMTITNDLTLAAASGTFTAPAGVLTIGGAFNKTGAIGFTHNSGTVMMTSTAAESFASGGATFNNLTLNDGLIGYWKLDETSIGTAADSSGYANSLTQHNSPSSSTTVAPLDFVDARSAAFTGVNGNNSTTPYFSSGTMPSTLQPSVVTLSAWYRATGTASSGGEIVSGSNRYGLRVFSSTQIKVVKQSATSTWVELTATAPSPLNGNWHHIAGVITGSGMTAYFDGAQVGSNTDTAAIFYGTSVNTAVNSGSIGYLNIGRNQDTANYEFSGNIDDVRIYNRALSATEIAALAAGGVPATSVGSQTLSGSPTVAGDLLIASNSLAVGSNTINVGGDLQVYSGGFTVSSGGFNFNGSGTGNYIYTGGSTLNDLTVSGTGAWTISDQTQVNLNGDLAISAGTLTSTPGLLLILGAFNKTGGTFTHNSGTVMLASPTSQTFATNGTTFNNLVINDGLVGYWPLDETTIGTAADMSGYGNSATAYNTPASSTSVPTVDFTDARSVSFAKASTQYLGTSTSTMPTVLRPSVVSLSAWYKATSVDASGSELISGNNRYALRVVSNTQVAVFKQTGSGSWVTLTGTVTNALDGNWHHVAGVITGSGMTLYFDGASVTTNSDTSAIYYTSLTGGVTIGRNPTTTIQFANGNIDEVRIYNRALTAVEVKSLANGDVPGSKAATHTMTGAPTVAGDLTIASGELAVSTNNMTVTGNWYNYGGRFTPGVQTVTLNGSGSTVLQSGNQVFNNVTYAGAGTLTLSGRLELDPGATFNMSAGTVNLSSYTLRAGNLTRSGGTLTPSASTVVLDGDSNGTITGNSFNNLRIEPVGATNLVGYWKLDESQGTVAHDYSTTNAGLTLTNSPVWIDSGLPSTLDFENAGAVTFDRTQSQSLAGSTLVSAQMPSVVTMSAWYKATSVDTSGADILSGSNRYALRLFSSTQIKIVKQTASSTWVELLATVSNPLDGNWHHIAGVITTTGMVAYFDGAQVASNSDVSPIYYTSPGAMTIGSNPVQTTSYRFTGSIDDVRIYNTALSSSQIKTLANGAYPAGLAGTPTYTLGASATVAGAFAIDNGTFNTGTGFTFNNSASSPAAVVNSGSYTVGTAASTFSPGLTVTNDGTLTMVNSGGAVKIGSTKTLTMDGTLNASNTGATIQTAGSAGTYYSFKVGSSATATPTLNITGLAVKNTDTNGMYINAVAGSTTTFTRFDNIAFSGGTGTQLLQIYSPSLYLFSNGCTFDSGTTGTTTYNVTLTGDGSATETRVLFGGATCASNKTPCEAYDNDNDSNTDGVGDTAATNGAVVQWIAAAQSDTNGTIEGFPTAAFDWSTFVYYSTYVLFHDVDSGTADRIYVRDASGNAKYSWDGPSGTDFVGAPRFDTASSVHYVYVATASGKVYRLIDNGSSLAQDNSGSWAGSNNPFDCACTITTPITLDSTNLYWGGILTSGSVNKVWTLAKSTRTLASSSPLTTTALVSGAAPALWVNTSTYLFVGESTHFDKLNVTSQALTTTNASPTGTVNGRITIVNNKLFGADTAGKLWVLDPSAAGLTPLWTYHDDTNHNGCTSGVCAVTGSLYVDWLSNRAFYGDSDGHLYATYNSSGTTGAQITTGWPYRPGTSSEVYATAPFYNSGVMVAGTTTGNVYVIDINGGSGPVLLQTYKLGTTMKVSGVGYDKTGANYLISAADPTTKNGDVFYIAAVADPTPGSN